MHELGVQPDPHLHDRLRGEELQRARRRRAQVATALRHRAPRADRAARRRARCCRRWCALRRAVRRLVGDPGLLRLRAGAPAREGRALGRGRRRGPRRLRDLPRPARSRRCTRGCRRPIGGRLVPASCGACRCRTRKVSFDYKAKRFVTGAYLPPAAGHLWWKTILDEDAKAASTRDGVARDVRADGAPLRGAVRTSPTATSSTACSTSTRSSTCPPTSWSRPTA